ncbi:MAG TPA: T9SS type A sorting domain-containing protein [Bacteroidia bacterium]|nr:T9SS type A sorting domain-containing protein [Bacteroidia bacterium]HMU19397.1 T9SS type A sorting domain-containing protein [Bacteroidia bacterium]
MKKYLTVAAITIICCLINLSVYAQQITITLNPSSPAAICESNTYTGLIILDGSVQAFPLSFEFAVSATVRNGNTIISLPATPAPTYIPCGNNTANLNPAKIELIDALFDPSDGCVQLSASPPIFTPSDNKYKWTVNVNPGSCTATRIEIPFTYTIFLDCSLIPEFQPTSSNQQLSLDVYGEIVNVPPASFFTAAVPIPYVADAIVPSIAQAVHVGGNYGQTDDMVFEYKNVGFAPLTVDFSFTDLFNCTGAYDVLYIGYSTDGTNYTAGTAGLPLGASGISLASQQTLYVKQRIKIKDCIDNICGSATKAAEFKWRCTNSQASCAVCQKTYITPFVFDYDEPEFTVEFANAVPTDLINQYDPSCIGDAQTWIVKVKNISDFSTLEEINLSFSNPSAGTSLSIIKSNQFPIIPINSLPLPTTFLSPTPTLNVGAMPCNTAGSTSVNNFLITINNLRPQEFYEFPIVIEKCCVPVYSTAPTASPATSGVYNTSWESMLSFNKPFNQWIVLSTGTTICGNNFDETPVTNNPPAINNLALNILQGISTHSNSNVTDINLEIDFPVNGSDIDVPPKIAGLQYRYGDRTTQTMSFTGIFGDSFDKQVLGYTGGATSSTGILRATIHCEQGLVIDDMANDVELFYTTSLAPTVPIPVTLYKGYSDNLPNPVNTNGGGSFSPFPNCEIADYDFYYDLSTIANIDDFFEQASFRFTMTSCCNAADITPYKVRFSLLPQGDCQNFATGGTSFSVNPITLPAPNNAYSFCWLPLSESGFHYNVHCPGCRAPGMIVDYYEMFRNSFGYLDADNNRVADLVSGNLVPLNSGNLPAGIDKNKAVHGDLLIDRMIAHFEPGSADPVDPLNLDPNFRGYTYQPSPPNAVAGDMQAVPPLTSVINLNVLQLNRTIPGGGCGKMAVTILSADFYIDDVKLLAAPPVGSCVDCGDFPLSDRFQFRNTLYKIHLDATALVSGGSYYEESSSGVLGADKNMMFTFHVDDLHSLQPGASLVFGNAANLSLYRFLENHQYRLVVNYKIDGNTYTGNYYSPVDDDLHITSEIKNWMWLTGGSKDALSQFPEGFTLLNHDQRPQMPNIIFDANDPLNVGYPPSGALAPDMESDGLVFNASNTYCSVPTSCTQANQINMGDYYKYYCEPRGNTFHFYSSDFYNITGFGNSSGTPMGCEKVIRTTTITSYGKGKYGSSGTANHKDLFPFEFRPPALLPHSFVYKDIPAGYALSTPQSTQVFNYYYFNGGVFSTGNTATWTPNLASSNLTFNQSQIGAFQCLAGVPGPPGNPPPTAGITGVSCSDEWFQQVTLVYLQPDCQSAGSLSQSFQPDDAKVNFGEITSTQACPITTTYSNSTACNINGATRDNDYGNGYFVHPNPNLDLQFSPAQITAITADVCWNFTMSNQNVTSAPPHTAAYNVYLQVPNTPSNELTGWTISYDYDTHTNLQPPITTTANGNYFSLFPIPDPVPTNPPLVPNFPVGTKTVKNGKICAKYSPCFTSTPQNLNFNWGWDCTENILLGSTCDNTTSVVTLENEFPNIQVDVGSLTTNATGGVNVCDTYTMSAEFINFASGAGIPNVITFVSASPFDIVPGSVIISDCNGGAGTYQPVLQPDGTYLINMAACSTALGLLHEHLAFSECLKIEANFIPKCQFSGTLQMPEIQLGYYTFCDDQVNPPTNNAVATFEPVLINGTSCTDCFSIEKTATPDLVIDGIEEVTYTVTVCSFNNVAQTVNLWDVLPVNFNLTSLDPFNGATQGNPFQDQFLASVGSVPNCSIYVVKGYTGGDACNDAFLEFGGVILTATVCPDLAASCSTNYAQDLNTFIIPHNTFISSYPPGHLFWTKTQYVVAGKFTIDVSRGFKGRTFLMETGSEIVVNPNVSFSLKDVYMSACSQKMWKGITMSNDVPWGSSGSTVYITGSHIYDAERALSVRDFCIASVISTEFYNNYIGVYVSSPNPLMGAGYINNISLYLDNNLFAGSGMLMLPYQGQTTALGFVPKAGIEVNRLMLSTASASRGLNQFINLSNGILGYRSNLRLSQLYFENIQPDPVYDNLTIGSFSVNYNGSAIYGNGFKTNFMIDQMGLGNLSSSQPTFRDCHIGVSADRIEVNSHDNIMQNVDNAYHVRIPFNRVIIANNTIDANLTAIHVFQYDLAPELNIWENTITFGSTPSPLFANWAINVDGNKMGTDIHKINSNHIYYRPGAASAFGGIFSNFTSGLQITNNTLHMDDIDVNHNGIFTTEGDYSLITCNDVNKATQPNGTLDENRQNTQSAIAVEMGSDPTVGCNEMHKTNNGLFVVAAVGGTNTELKGNDFYNHGNALRYSFTATTADQDLKGNVWNVPSPPAGFRLALNENPSYDPQVTWNDVGPPGTNTLLPNNNFQVPNDWFQPYLLPNPPNYECANDQFACVSAAYSNMATDFDYLVATDQIENDPYTDETRWMFKKDLYKRIEENPSLQTDAVLNNFYISMQGTTLAELVPVEADKNELFVPDNFSEALLQQYRADAAQQLTLIEHQMVLLDTAFVNDDTATVRTLSDDIIDLQETVTATNMLAEDVIADDAADRITTATAVGISNSILAATNTPEENEQIVNEIYLRTIGSDVFEFTQDDVETLYSIGIQCPMQGGNAVFFARSLYALVDKDKQYDDFKICNLIGIELRKPGKEKDGIIATIYPNPANESTTVKYIVEKESKVEFVLRTTTNQQILHKSLQGGESKYTFSTTDLKPAVYFYELRSNGELITNGKLVILR